MMTLNRRSSAARAISAPDLQTACRLYPEFAGVLQTAQHDVHSVRLRRNGLLHAAPDVPTRVFFPLEGMLRVHFSNAHGKDVTNRVAHVGEPLALWHAMVTQQASPHSVSAVHSAHVLSVAWDVIAARAEAEPLVSAHMLASLAQASQRYDSVLGSSPAERYARLHTNRPWMLRELPRHMLASYLGVTTVHLGRLSKAHNAPAQPTNPR